jgi:hypothetical protein
MLVGFTRELQSRARLGNRQRPPTRREEFAESTWQIDATHTRSADARPTPGHRRAPGEDDVFNERRLCPSRLQPAQPDVTAQDDSGDEHDQPKHPGTSDEYAGLLPATS